MSKVPSLNYDEVVRALRRDGWVVVRQRGSHIRLHKHTSNETLKLVVPAHRPNGSADQIREDLGRYAEAGVTELFLEPNFAPGGGSLDRALEALATFRPHAYADTRRG